MLGELLIRAGYITEDQLARALEEGERSGRRLGEVLVERGDISREDLLHFLQHQLGHPVVGLARTHIDEALAKTLPERFCRTHGVLPLYRAGERVVVAMADPTDLVAQDQLRLSLGSEIEVMAARAEELEEAFRRVFGGGPPAPPPTPAAHLAFEDSRPLLPAPEDKPISPSLVELLDHMFKEALRLNATSIHLEPKARHLSVRYRVAGFFQEATAISNALKTQVTARIKMLAKMDPNEKVRTLEEGRFHIRPDVAAPPIDCRVSVIPALHGENVVVRLSRRDEVIRPLGALGLEPDQEAVLRSVLNLRRGLVLVSGPTDSGKTTTIYSILGEIMHPSLGIVTLEDPIEYPIASFNQMFLPTPDSPAWHLTYRAVLRQEPHCVYLSEVRGPKTAWMATRLAETGRLVLTSLYADDAVSAHWVLFQHGADSHAVASVLAASVAVRLVRKICTSCKEETEPTGDVLARLGVPARSLAGRRFYRGAGCVRCNNTGYLDRTAVFEVLSFAPHLSEMVADKTPSEKMRDAALDAGMRPLRDVAIEKAARGETSLEEIARVL